MFDNYGSLVEIRRNVFIEVAKLAYEGGDYSRIEEIPYTMINRKAKEEGQAQYRESIFLERAIVAERLRLAIGLPVRSADEHTPISKGIEEAIRTSRYYEPPLINIIDFACNACPEDSYYVTDVCVGCLAHPCANVCPKGAITIVNGRSHIDQEKCIKCGRCMSVCPYKAIAHRERPCQKACGMGAITSDKFGKAKINYDKCVSCGMCLVNCPFGAIADKSQIFQVIQSIKEGEDVYALMAPAFVGQFGPKVTRETIDDAMEKLGFKGVYDVSIGADLCTVAEAEDFLKEVPDKLKFMGTSCCPSWSVMAKKDFPEFKDNISMALTPMVLTGRLVKKRHKNAKIVFVGPCAAKKLEASRRSVRSDVDFVLTFEELMAMFIAKGVDFNTLEKREPRHKATADGRGFAVAGGVANAVVNACRTLAPGREIKVKSAQGLKECRKMLQEAKAGKYDGYLLEGMACPFGCASGAGTITQPSKTKALVGVAQREAEVKNAIDSKYVENIKELD